MNKWRSLMTGIIASAFIGLNPATASADICNPCDPCLDWCNPCCWNFTVGADFLWWKPCIDDLDVAAIVTTDGDERDVEYEAICPEWEPGIRVWLELPNFFCGWDLTASYAYIKSSDSASQGFNDPDDDNGIISPLLFTGLPDFDAITTFSDGDERWELFYHEWDLLMSYDICCNSCHHLTPYFGIAGIVLNQKLEAEFFNDNTDDEAFVEWESDYWGVGLRAGSYYEYEFGCGLSLYANAQASLLAGNADTENEQLFLPGSSALADSAIEFEDDDCCHFVPGYRITAGLSYEGCLCDWQFGARVGYEMVYWHNVPNHRVFFGNDPAEVSHSTSPSTRSLAFHGLVAGLWVGF